jgi:chorismate mutase
MTPRPSRTATPEPGTGKEPDPELAELRSAIETLDDALVELVARRLRLSALAGAGKRSAGRPVLDPGREAAVVARAAAAGRDLGIPEEGLRELFWTLIRLCRTAQQEG